MVQLHSGAQWYHNFCLDVLDILFHITETKVQNGLFRNSNSSCAADCSFTKADFTRTKLEPWHKQIRQYAASRQQQFDLDIPLLLYIRTNHYQKHNRIVVLRWIKESLTQNFSLKSCDLLVSCCLCDYIDLCLFWIQSRVQLNLNYFRWLEYN